MTIIHLFPIKSFFLFFFSIFSWHFVYGEDKNSDAQVESSLKQVAENLEPEFLKAELDSKDKLISMTVITEDDIKKCIGCDLMDILERAGVQLRRFHRNFYQSSDTDSAYVGLRGSSDTQTLLLVDGIRQEDKTRSEPTWTTIPIHHIQRIEIVKGPQSAYYGDSAIGGVIHIFTKKADCPSGEFCTQVNTQISNESNTGRTLYVSSNTRTDRSGIRVGFQGDESHDPEKTGDYTEKAISLNFDHSSGDEDWLIEGSAIVYDDRSKGKPNIRIKKTSSNLASLGTTYYASPEMLFKALLGYNEEEQLYSRSLTKYKSQRLSLKLWGEYHFDFLSSQYKLSAGIEEQKDEIGSKPQEYDQTKRDTSAIFTNIKGGQGPFNYQVAIRLDDLSGDTKEKVFTWSGSAFYHITKIEAYDVILRTGLGKGFREPGFDEKVANPSLKLEKAENKEIGIRIEKGQYYFLDIAGFKTKIKDPVLYIYNEDSKKRVDIEGVEVQLGFKEGAWSGQVQYSHVDTDHTEKLRAHNPVKHLAGVNLEYSINSNLSIGGHLLHRGKREDDSFRGDSVNVLDIYSFYDLNDNIMLGFSVRNVTDKKYDQYNNTEGPRRTVWLSLTGNF